MSVATVANGWNHNTHYHDFVLSVLPAGCRRVLDVGCGDGQLALKLAQHCEAVVAVDVDPATIAQAAALTAGNPRISLRLGDVLAEELWNVSFDAIVAVASLHHMPLEPALMRLRDLLNAGGALVVVGLYRLSTPMDYLWAALAAPLSWLARISLGEAKMDAPIAAPKETLEEIRVTAVALLASARVRRRLFFRYTLVWRKP